MKRGLIAAAFVGLPVFLSAPAVLACGFHDPKVVAQGIYNHVYPNALHITGAVWSAQQAGVLAMPDRERLMARGQARALLDEQAFARANQALFALGDAFGAAETPLEHHVAVLLLEQVLWTRFAHADDGVSVKSHAPRAQDGDLVIVTDAPVLHAIDDGTLTFAKAYELEVVRFYGTPEQERAFLETHGNIGAEPLPEISERDLFYRMMGRRPRPLPNDRKSDEESRRGPS